MKDIFDILKELLPLWLALLALCILYLIYLYTRYIKNKNDFSNEKTNFFKDKYEIFDKEYVFYEKIIERYKQEFENECKKNEEYKRTIVDIKTFYSQRLDNLHCISKKMEQTIALKNRNDIVELQKEILSIKFDSTLGF